MEWIIIIGGGIAGLAAAIALRRSFPSAQLVIFEACPGETHKGFGFILMDNGVRALKNLKADKVLANATPIARARVRSNGGDVIVDETFQAVSCCSRKDILEGLGGLLGAAGAKDAMRVNKKCTGVEVADDQVTAIFFEDGTSIEVSPDDLVVAADGVRSVACAAFNPNLKRPISSVHEVVTSTRAPGLAPRIGNSLHKIHCIDDGLAFGLCCSTPTQVIGYVQFDASRYGPPDTTEQKKALFDMVVRKIEDPVQRDLFEEYTSIVDMDMAYHWRPVNSDLPARLRANNAVLIGDAAHPLLPFTSQGTSMALDDAVILAQTLKDPVHPTLKSALNDFVEKRRPASEEFIAKGREILAGFIKGVSVVPYVKKEKDENGETSIVGRNDTDWSCIDVLRRSELGRRSNEACREKHWSNH